MFLVADAVAHLEAATGNEQTEPLSPTRVLPWAMELMRLWREARADEPFQQIIGFNAGERRWQTENR
jgi:hypothetical protein